MASICPSVFDCYAIGRQSQRRGRGLRLASALSTANFAPFTNGGSGKHGEPRIVAAVVDSFHACRSLLVKPT